ncbi:hypothetical protein [Flavobacterium sp.]|uniref:hypothetical protein n=1 Tax=Flavobacterium sp. TaxID=239 RepID=UPI0026254536|nr:hypothetical protein [Flavobacterium sp.]
MDNNNDYITVNKKRYITVNYIHTKTLNTKSPYQILIINKNENSVNVFSTVLENSLMFYSHKNISIKKSLMIFDSHYKNYMKDAVHSGEKKIKFIVIPPNDTLTVNINPNVIPDVRKIRLRYYYFISDEDSNLLQIDNILLLHSEVELDSPTNINKD